MIANNSEFLSRAREEDNVNENANRLSSKDETQMSKHALPTQIHYSSSEDHHATAITVNLAIPG